MNASDDNCLPPGKSLNQFIYTRPPPSKRRGGSSSTSVFYRTVPPLPQALVPKPISNRTAMRKAIPREIEDKSPLQLTLSHLHQVLVRRDRQCFFQTPITDDIAPGYSSVVDRPMDFSVMAHKILDGVYVSVGEYRDDFRLMCENAMKYNPADSVYYEEAKKLLSMGIHKVLTRQRVRAMRRSFGFVRDLKEEQIALSSISVAFLIMILKRKLSPKRRTRDRYEKHFVPSIRTSWFSALPNSVRVICASVSITDSGIRRTQCFGSTNAKRCFRTKQLCNL
ncbi:hypothetical protein ACOME3_009166 [Neoechinorhynchus agilis]